MIGKIGVKKPAARKNRDGDHVDAPGARNEVRGHGHFRHFEFLKLELAPKSLRGLRIGGDQLDAVGCDRAIHEGLYSFVKRGNETQSQLRHLVSWRVRGY